jgi:hypothetical protein
MTQRSFHSKVNNPAYTWFGECLLYASFCDLFITDDERTAKKTEAVYKYLKIQTKVLTMRQLSDWVNARWAL